MSKVKLLQQLSDQVITLAHKVTYAFEITEETSADELILDLCDSFEKLLKQYGKNSPIP